ncbi:MAG: Division initiation protein [uncultured Corynebacteriales bacterium]|uniref:Division initiation protein n=1 Tax=uncultured Mycobacteriales bacterium TaxID=581187 RepID=A0A6J4JMD4_9ACTN|nr:MAG: Division initiation protein [uncultured Corynebacteriales bacterium]
MSTDSKSIPPGEDETARPGTTPAGAGGARAAGDGHDDRGTDRTDDPRRSADTVGAARDAGGPAAGSDGSPVPDGVPVPDPDPSGTAGADREGSSFDTAPPAPTATGTATGATATGAAGSASGAATPDLPGAADGDGDGTATRGPDEGRPGTATSDRDGVGDRTPDPDGDGAGAGDGTADPDGDRPGTTAPDPDEDDTGDQSLVPVAAGPDGPDGGDPARPWWRPSPAAVLVGLLLGLLGFALAVQVRSNTSTSGLPAARQEDLVRILDDLSSREERLRRQIAELEAARSRLSTTGDRTSTALAEARTRSTALGILAGTVPAQGPGVELSIGDPARRLTAEDLLDAVEELRAAGAEAIQVGGVRIGLDSAFTRTDRAIAVDGVPLAVPYTILAIGDPSTLATAMEIPGGVSDTAGRAGGQARITQRELVRITVLRTPRTPRYSEPAD